ncbi:MAG TPA: hypothetical protein VF593_06935, partial [Chthoniobacteraceae bacterium]
MIPPLLLPLLILAALVSPVAAAAPAETRSYYIAKAPAAPGDGSLERPFIVNSAPELTAVLQSLPAHSHIHFLAGTFPCEPIQFKEGWQITGAGMDLTILSALPAEKTAVMMFSDFPTEVRDLTLDANAAASPVPVQGLSIYARRGVVERVKVVESGGPGAEAFPILMAGRGTEPCQFIVRDCLIADTATHSNGSTAIILCRWSSGGVPTPAGSDGDFGLVEGNTILGGGGLGIAGFSHATFRHNYVENTGKPFNGFNSDTGGNSHLVIEGNTFIGSAFPFTSYGVINLGSSGHPSEHARIRGNYIKLDANGYVTSGVRIFGNVLDAEVSGNIIIERTPTKYAESLRSISVEGPGNQRLRLVNNR